MKQALSSAAMSKVAGPELTEAQGAGAPDSTSYLFGFPSGSTVARGCSRTFSGRNSWPGCAYELLPALLVSLLLFWQRQALQYCQCTALGCKLLSLKCKVMSAGLTCISVASLVVAGPGGLVWGASTPSPPQAGESHPAQGLSRTPRPPQLSASAPPPPVGSKGQLDLWG